MPPTDDAGAPAYPHSAQEPSAAQSSCRGYFEAAHEGFVLLDAHTGRITDVNPFLLDLLGYRRAEVVGKALWEIGAPGDTAASQATFHDLRKHGSVRYEHLPRQAKDGRLIDAEVVGSQYRLGHTPVIGCTIRDITARKRAEEGIRYRATVLDAICVGQAVLATARDGTITFWNDTARRLFGWSAEEVIGQYIVGVTPAHVSHTKSTEMLAQVQTGQPWSVEVEALARWFHPQRGPIPPGEFIPLAEQHGLIGALTLCVLEEALRQAQCWQQAGLDLGVAVNLSMWNLHDPEFPELMRRLLHLYKLPAGRVRLELTESTLMADTARSLDVLERLRALGVRLSVDDFGTGYSSLAYLKRLPVDELKIEMSFVRHMAEQETDAALVRATIDLGHSVGLEVVAEGVENQQSWDLLAQWGCDRAQGFYLSRPLPAAELEQWLCAPSRAADRLSA